MVEEQSVGTAGAGGGVCRMIDVEKPAEGLCAAWKDVRRLGRWVRVTWGSKRIWCYPVSTVYYCSFHCYSMCAARHLELAQTKG